MALKPCPRCGLESYDWDLDLYCARCRVNGRVAALFAPKPVDTMVLAMKMCLPCLQFALENRYLTVGDVVEVVAEEDCEEEDAHEEDEEKHIGTQEMYRRQEGRGDM